ncbi:hypothetical protein J2W57_003467 [Chryseobacterium ginsenosidimutans]|nr:hypothetical protein [Chryseobacterium ginsenosidimutans]
MDSGFLGLGGGGGGPQTPKKRFFLIDNKNI